MGVQSEMLDIPQVVFLIFMVKPLMVLYFARLIEFKPDELLPWENFTRVWITVSRG